MINSFLGDRFEFKYVLSPQRALDVINFFEKVGLYRDENSKHEYYVINSLYFDTPFMDDYRDKDGSLLIRKKMRVRMYEDLWADDLDRVWFEIKRKRNMNIYKTRAEVPGHVFKDFIDNKNPFALSGVSENKIEQAKLNEFQYIYIKQAYRPNTIVKYRRLAFLDKFLSSVRVTFDKDIVASRADSGLIHERDTVPVSWDDVIMEVKFNDQLPWWFTKARDIFNLRRTDYSKYVHSVLAVREGLKVGIPR